MSGNEEETAVGCASTVRGAGVPVVLIHGIGARRQCWDEIAKSLAAHHTVISYDLRGHGESPLPDGSFGLAALVADLEALRARLQLDAMHVVGHSLGGMIGPAYARRYPGRVLSLGLLSTAAFRTAEDRAALEGVISRLEEQGAEALLPMFAKRWFTDGFVETHADVVRRRQTMVAETDPEVFLNVFRIYADTEMGPWLHEIDIPTLVLTGEFDGGCSPRLNRAIADAMPRSRLVVLDGLRHDIVSETPMRIAPVVADFLADQHVA
jgi:3-oxoadipate enol-lactonase